MKGVRHGAVLPVLSLLALALAAPVPVRGATENTGGGSPAAALSLRREYNEVAAAIDTLVRLYTPERLQGLTDPERTPGVELPEGTRLVLLMWADDEAMVYLNGAPVGETRLTPTRIDIPALYLQPDNRLTARCWDTDRVESGFMAGLYVEQADGALQPVVTTTEDEGWTAAGPDLPATPAREIYYAHTQPDLPGAQVIWGPQLFGRVELSVGFTAQQVRRAARQAPTAVAPSGLRKRDMDLDQAMGRLVGLQTRRRELATRLQASGGPAERPAVAGHLRYRSGSPTAGLSYTLGQAAPLEADIDREVTRDMSEWIRRRPEVRQQLVERPARPLLGPEAATPAAPLEAGSAAAQTPVDRRADYQPPQDRGTSGEGGGTRVAPGGSGAYTRRGPSAAFLWRMGLMALALTAWTGVASWRGRVLWHSVSWTRNDRP